MFELFSLTKAEPKTWSGPPHPTHHPTTTNFSATSRLARKLKVEEDDLKKSKDDPKVRGDSEDNKSEINDTQGVPEVPDMTIMTRNKEDSLSTLPLRKEDKEAAPSSMKSKESTSCVDSRGTVRAIAPPVKTEDNLKWKDNLLRKTEPRGITVNGVSLIDIMKKKKEDRDKMTPGRQNSAKFKKKNNTTSTPPIKKITNFFKKGVFSK